jgi:hypothetical protein
MQGMHVQQASASLHQSTKNTAFAGSCQQPSFRRYQWNLAPKNLIPKTDARKTSELSSLQQDTCTQAPDASQLVTQEATKIQSAQHWPTRVNTIPNAM